MKPPTLRTSYWYQPLYLLHGQLRQQLLLPRPLWRTTDWRSVDTN